MTDFINFPAGWKVVTLGEIAIPSDKKVDPNKIKDVAYIGLEHIEKDTGKLLGFGSSGKVISTKSSFEKCDLLYGKLRPYLNKVWIAEFDGVCSTDILVFPQSMFVLNSFLFYRLLSGDFVRYAHQKSAGVNLPRTSYKAISQFKFPLPPLDEQQRIVARIEELFTQLDAGVAALEAVRRQVKRYRQAVLQAAVIGLISKDFRKKYSNEVVESYKNGLSLPEGWFEATIEELTENIADCLHSTPKFQASGRVCVDSNCIKPGTIIYEKARFVDEETFNERNRRLKPQENDIIFSREGALLGVAVILHKNIDICLGQRMMIFRLKQRIKPHYFEFLLNSPYFKSLYKPKISGTAAPHLNIGEIRQFCIPVPPLSEQDFIISDVENHLTVIDQMEKSIDQSLRQAARLRQSILQRAFTGRL